MGHRYVVMLLFKAVMTKSYLAKNCFTRIQVMNYNPSSDTIEIVHYTKNSAQNDPANVYKYKFLLYSKVTEVRVDLIADVGHSSTTSSYYPLSSLPFSHI